MSERLVFDYVIDGDNFTLAGNASVAVKKKLRLLGISPDAIRRVSVAMYEGEINMVIHAGGGEALVTVSESCVEIVLKDRGPGIVDIDKAMEAGYSTAPDSIRSLGFGAGMGLPNMKKNSDDMQISSVVGVGTTITMKINI